SRRASPTLLCNTHAAHQSYSTISWLSFLHTKRTAFYLWCVCETCWTASLSVSPDEFGPGATETTTTPVGPVLFWHDNDSSGPQLAVCVCVCVWVCVCVCDGQDCVVCVCVCAHSMTQCHSEMACARPTEHVLSVNCFS